MTLLSNWTVIYDKLEIDGCLNKMYTGIRFYLAPRILFYLLLYVQEVVTQPQILNRTILSNLIHVT